MSITDILDLTNIMDIFGIMDVIYIMDINIDTIGIMTDLTPPISSL